MTFFFYLVPEPTRLVMILARCAKCPRCMTSKQPIDALFPVFKIGKMRTNDWLDHSHTAMHFFHASALLQPPVTL